MRTLSSLKLLAFMVGLLVGGFAVHVFYKQKNTDALDDIAALSAQVGPLEREVAKLRQDLATCHGAQVDSEASLEDFYQELMFAHRFDMVVFNDDGQARRLVFDCGTGDDEE